MTSDSRYHLPAWCSSESCTLARVSTSFSSLLRKSTSRSSTLVEYGAASLRPVGLSDRLWSDVGPRRASDTSLVTSVPVAVSPALSLRDSRDCLGTGPRVRIAWFASHGGLSDQLDGSGASRQGGCSACSSAEDGKQFLHASSRCKPCR